MLGSDEEQELVNIPDVPLPAAEVNLPPIGDIQAAEVYIPVGIQEIAEIPDAGDAVVELPQVVAEPDVNIVEGNTYGIKVIFYPIIS